jgi:hypothetical protein
LRKPVERSQATTPKLFYRRPSATAAVTVPGEIAHGSDTSPNLLIRRSR